MLLLKIELLMAVIYEAILQAIYQKFKFLLLLPLNFFSNSRKLEN